VADSHAASYYDDPAFVQRVADLLGPSVLTADGQADKRRIADIVFANPEALQQLNALIHPRVMDDFHRWAQQQLSPYVILESAILYEYGLHHHMDCMIAVYLDQ
jgi:dephospho-CoA kinase